MKKKIGICANFGNTYNTNGGQVVKSLITKDEIEKKYGSNNVISINTDNFKKNIFSIIKDCFKIASKCDNIIILPAQRGIKIIVPLFIFLKSFYRFKLHYIVIGAWLADLIKDNKFMLDKIKKIDYIYLETNNTINKLKKLGINNLYQMNNFKKLEISTYNRNDQKKFKCCIFSRIEKEKGVTDAINVVTRIKNENDIDIILDIYGIIKKEYEEEFNLLLKGKEKYIRYCGVVDYNNSVSVLEKYHLLLFPTRYKTEGIPGTIIDAYFSRLPVLASKWENFDEVVRDNYTGIGYKFMDIEDFYKHLMEIINNKKDLNRMKENCGIEAEKYLPKNSIDVLIKNIEDGL